MPSSHRRYADWTPERFRRWAGSVGPQTEGLIMAILAHRPHPEQGFRTCLGVLGSSARSTRPGRSRLGPRARDRRAHLQEHRLHPPIPQGAQASRRTRRRQRARQPARPRLLPLRRLHMLTHPTLDLLHALGLHGMAKRFPRIGIPARGTRPRACRLACPAARAGGDAAPPEALRGPARAARLRHDARSRMSTSAQLAVSTAGSSSSWRLRLDPPAAWPAADRAGRRRQELAGLRARPQGLPGGPLGRSTTACRGCLRRWLWRAATAAMAACSRPSPA